jgi:hypothetical protein
MKRPVVVILGMHRSGTSLLANFINAIGVDFPQDLIPANEWNAAGNWESWTIHDIHENVLKELDCSWNNLPLSLPVDWWLRPEIQTLKRDLVEFVRSECRRSDKVWGFKDPRGAVLLPMWQEIFDELQLAPLYVLAVRNPGSVAASLERRDRLAFSDSQALWLKTNIDALKYTRNSLRAVVDYDRWFHSGLEQARTVVDSLNLPQQVSEEQIANAVNLIIHRELRHHSPEQLEICSPIVARFYSLLCAIKDGKIPYEISEITTTFENSMDFLNIWDDLVKQLREMVRHRNAAIAERETIINNFDKKRIRYKRQRKYLVIALVVFVSVSVYSLVVCAHNWLK